MEIILSVCFLGGAAIGLAVPFGRDILVSIGMIVINIANMINPLLVMVISGYFVSAFIHNLMSNVMKAKKEHNKTTSWIVNANESYVYMWRFIGIFLIALIGFSIIESSFFSFTIIMFFSLVKIIGDIADFIYAGGRAEGTIRRILGILVLGVMASITINNVNSGWATAGYFTALLSVSSISKTKQELKEEAELTFWDAFRFGSAGGHAGPTYLAIVLAQSIIWGSQKDSLGTLLNVALPGHLDSFRIIWGLLVALVIYIASTIAISTYEYEGLEDTKEDSLMKYILIGINAYLLIINLGFIYIIALLLLGLIVSKCIGSYELRQFSVPSLLLAAAF